MASGYCFTNARPWSDSWISRSVRVRPPLAVRAAAVWDEGGYVVSTAKRIGFHTATPHTPVVEVMRTKTTYDIVKEIRRNLRLREVVEVQIIDRGSESSLVEALQGLEGLNLVVLPAVRRHFQGGPGKTRFWLVQNLKLEIPPKAAKQLEVTRLSQVDQTAADISAELLREGGAYSIVLKSVGWECAERALRVIEEVFLGSWTELAIQVKTSADPGVANKLGVDYIVWVIPRDRSNTWENGDWRSFGSLPVQIFNTLVVPQNQTADDLALSLARLLQARSASAIDVALEDPRSAPTFFQSLARLPKWLHAAAQVLPWRVDSGGWQARFRVVRNLYLCQKRPEPVLIEVPSAMDRRDLSEIILQVFFDAKDDRSSSDATLELEMSSPQSQELGGSALRGLWGATGFPAEITFTSSFIEESMPESGVKLTLAKT